MKTVFFAVRVPDMTKPTGTTKKKVKRAGTTPLPHEEEQMLREAFENSPIPAFVIDRDHRIICWNRALEMMSGITASEVIGAKDHWKVFYHERRPTIADLIVDGRQNEIPHWYPGKYNKSK
ncbi:MAG: PAS domain S-box protein, partial [Syntrophobacterales bacterium]